VIATSGVQRAAADQFLWGTSESVEIKGRSGMETVFPVIACKTSEKAEPGDPTTSQNGTAGTCRATSIHAPDPADRRIH